MATKISEQALNAPHHTIGDNLPMGSLGRGLAIIAAIRDGSGPMSLAEIAAATGLDGSTALRLLRTLEESGHVLRMTDSKAYTLSPSSLLPLPLMHPINQLRREIYSLIIELSARLNETIVLALFVGVERMAVDVAQSPDSLNPYYDTWLHGPRHATGVGKAQLLSMSLARRRTLLGPGPLPPMTPYTITDPAELERDLASAQERGYVVTRDEHQIGLTAVAAIISTWRNVDIGCIAATGHSRNFTDDRIVEVGQELSRFTKFLTYQAQSLNTVANYLGSRANNTRVSTISGP